MTKKVMIFLPLAKQSIDTEFFETYNRAKTYLYEKAKELPFEIQVLEYYAHTFPIDALRNECAMRMVEGIPLKGGMIFKPDVSIWLDTDHSIPTETLFNLLRHDRPIVLGVYYIKAPKRNMPIYPVLFRKREDVEGLYKAVMEFPEYQLFEVDMAGMGCACIKREVFEKLEMPFFKYMRHPQGSSNPESDWKNNVGIEDVSEDVWFWKQVKDKTNYPILVDPTIRLGHIGRMIFDSNMYDAYLAQYKKVMVEKHGEDTFRQQWSINAIAEPYKEVKIYDDLNAKVTGKHPKKRRTG